MKEPLAIACAVEAAADKPSAWLANGTSLMLHASVSS